jgi:hypothetical protein
LSISPSRQASFECADDSVSHLRAGKRVIGTIELVGGFQQSALLVDRNPTVALGLNLRLDFHAESVER